MTYVVQAQATAPYGAQAEWYDYETMTHDRETADRECDCLNRDNATATFGATVWDVLWVVVERKETGQ